MILIFLGTMLSAQTKNGTVYSEHETIDKTRDMWKAFQKGDADTFVSFFADSVYRFVNGKMTHIPRDDFRGAVKWWNESMENLVVKDYKPAFPDAIEYKKGGTWVQDWLHFKATHKNTGMNVDLHYHNLYSFNDDGKISSIHFYFNNNVFEEIKNSETTRENGKVYINHPYIVKVRKVLNAYVNKDVETWASYFSPKARFWYSTLKMNETKSFEEVKERLTKNFETMGEVKIEQVGYPDCIYYEKSNSYSVYSWWNVKRKDGDKKIEYPLMLTHNFDKDGKIEFALIYYSSNHFE